jgi:hypothetical protein
LGGNQQPAGVKRAMGLAQEHELPVLTANVKHFSPVEGLTV